MSAYQIPRHWEFDRECTWEEAFGKTGLQCIGCGIELTAFDQVATRLTDESAAEISFSEEDVIPIKELVCTKCEGAK